jgi:hypothetical protein
MRKKEYPTLWIRGRNTNTNINTTAGRRYKYEEIE